MAAPLFTSRTPSPNETNVYVNKYIEVVFDQSLDTTTLNDNTILLYRLSDYQLIDKKITFTAATNTVSISPLTIFDQNTQYNIVLVGADSSASCIKNSVGESMAVSLTWYFTTGTEAGDQPGETHEEEEPDTPSADSPVSAVLVPKATESLSIVQTYPENYAANLGTINGDYATVHFDGPITVKFDRAVASGVSVDQSWLTFDVQPVDGDSSIPTNMPSGYLYNTNGDTLTYAFPTYEGNNYAWDVNNEVTVTVSDHVKDHDGTELGTQYKFMFTTAYRPYYCTVEKTRAVIGSFLRDIPDDTIARIIYINSLEAYNIANTVYSQYVWDMDHPTFAAKMWTCCKTQYDLLYAKLLDMASVGPGMMKRLGDFTIQESTDIQAGVKGALQKSLDCANAWLKLLLGKFRRAKSQMVVKGVTNPATPPMRGVRTWTLETGRDTMGANKTLTRRIKSPGIYSDWS